MTNLYIRKVMFGDKSYFFRGECSDCDWLEESLWPSEIKSKAEVHLLVFHNGGIINFDKFKTEVKGNA